MQRIATFIRFKLLLSNFCKIQHCFEVKHHFFDENVFKIITLALNNILFYRQRPQ
jgi:hypothetical protein